VTLQRPLHALGALLLWVGFSAAGPLFAEGLKRHWKSKDNATREMVLVASDGATATFRVPGKRPIRIPLTRLAEEDRTIIRDWLLERAARPSKRPWPGSVEVTLAEIEIKELGHQDGWHVYETPHFRFRSEEKLAISLMREVARTFEATHRMVSQMPWALKPRSPGRKFEAELYRDVSSYQQAGGPPNTGGVYRFGYRDAAHYGKFLVPFESLGVRKLGGGYRKDDDFSSDTLVHELTHQLMHFSLFLIPNWVAEGSAEYFEHLPYQAGRFRPDGLGRALRERFDGPRPLILSKDLLGFIRGSDADWTAAVRSPQAMRHAYEQSLLLFYFFSHLEGNGEGERLLAYFGRVSRAQQQWTNYLDAWKDYMDAWDDFLQHPEVRRMPDGRYEFPDTMRPPNAPENPFPDGVASVATRLVEELVAGRNNEQLHAEIRAAYEKVGIEVR